MVENRNNIRLGVVFDRHVNSKIRDQYIERVYEIIESYNYLVEQGKITSQGGVLRLIKRN